MIDQNAPQSTDQPIAPIQPIIPTETIEPISNPITPISLTPSDTVSTIPPIVETKKSGKKGLCLIIVIIIFICGFVAFGIIGIFAISRVKEAYVPVFSPLFEDSLLKPNEQFAQRFDVYSGIVENVLAPANSGQQNQSASISDLYKNIDSLETTTQANIHVNLKDTEGFGVLGIDSEAGSVDEDQLTKMLSAKTFDFAINSKSTLSGYLNKTPKSKSENSITVNAAETQLKTNFDIFSESEGTKTDIFFFLRYFPENPYYNTSSLENKWIKYSYDLNAYTKLLPQDLIMPELSITPTPLDNPVDTKGFENLKKLLHDPVMEKVITSAPSERINGTNTKCYLISLDQNNILEIEKAYKSIDPTYRTSYDPETVKYFPITKITICTDDLLILRKVSFDIQLTSPYSDMTLKGFVQMNSFNQNYNLSAPTSDIINYEEIDWKKVVSEKLVQENEKNFSDTRNAQRSSDVAQILNAVSQYTSEQSHSISTLETLASGNKTINKIPVCPAVADLGSGNNSLDLTLPLVDDYIVGIPFDPSEGTEEVTGYTICITTGGRIKVDAPFAENGKVISVTR